MAKTKIQPINNNVLVRPNAAPDKIGSIYIADNAKEKPQQGEVLSVGPGKRLEDGALQALAVKAGDMVVYTRYAGHAIEIDGEELRIFDGDEILGVVE